MARSPFPIPPPPPAPNYFYEGFLSMPRNFFCKTCWDEGHLGFLSPDGWLAGEIGDNWPFCLLIKRTCPECKGDPRSLMPPRRVLYESEIPVRVSQQEYATLMSEVTNDIRPIFGMQK